MAVIKVSCGWYGIEAIVSHTGCRDVELTGIRKCMVGGCGWRGTGPRVIEHFHLLHPDKHWRTWSDPFRSVR